jgi:twitching motility protein PilT
MEDTAQNNQTNIAYPTFSDDSNQVSQPNYGDFSGKIDTIPKQGVHDSLEDIMPSHKKVKSQKEDDNVQPTENSEDYLVPRKFDQAKLEQQNPEDEQAPVSVVDLGNTPLPNQKENIVEDISMPDIHNISKQPEQQSIEATASKHKISDLLEQTIEKGASDLHISVGYPPVVRVDGELEEISEDIIDPVEAEELILPLMSDDKKELLEVNKEIDFAYTHEGKYNGRFRINAFYAMKSLSAAFRLIPNRIRTIEELKLPQIYHQFTKLRQGMILVTGPTGHGKSTTIAAMIEDINRSRFSRIITIEDPVEYIFQGKKSLIDQREMGQDTHSWPIALKSAMRQDPDVILVGEMRDYETISSAITLAETGHLVFATLHTNNSAQSIDRMIDVFPEEQQAQIRTQLSNILEVVIAQRLIPLERGGRRAVEEILVVNPAIKTLIRENKTHQIDNVIRTSSDVGMISLERSLVNLIREGVISTKIAQEFAVYPEEISRLLKS